MNPVSAAYFRRAREAGFGTKLENLVPADGAKDAATWGAFIAGLENIAAVYARNAGGDWFFGENFTFADAIVIAYLNVLKLTLGTESDEWKLIEGSAKGFWVDKLQKADALIRYDGKQ